MDRPTIVALVRYGASRAQVVAKPSSRRIGDSGTAGRRAPERRGGIESQICSRRLPMMAGDLVARLPSSRHADVVYEVRLEGGQYTCQCPAFWFRRRCRHVDALVTLRALPIVRTANGSKSTIG